MIFVTVGTHEQQFNRLIRGVDELKLNKVIREEVVMQTGYSDYEPQACEWNAFYPFSKMTEYVEQARIVITHGAPASFLTALQIGKIPVVVPRNKKFHEHVNNHQVDFCRTVFERQSNIILIEDIAQLENAVINYDSIVASMPKELKSNNVRFCENFTNIVNEMFDGGKSKT